MSVSLTTYYWHISNIIVENLLHTQVPIAMAISAAPINMRVGACQAPAHTVTCSKSDLVTVTHLKDMNKTHNVQAYRDGPQYYVYQGLDRMVPQVIL